jgi:hypothetical protein
MRKKKLKRNERKAKEKASEAVRHTKEESQFNKRLTFHTRHEFFR